MTKEDQTIRDDIADIVLLIRGNKIEDERIEFTINTYDTINEHKPISSEDAFRAWMALASAIAKHPSCADMPDWQKKIIKMPLDYLDYHFQVQKLEETESESAVKH